MTLLVVAVLAPLLVCAAFLLWRYAAAEAARNEHQALSLARQVAAAVDRELTGFQASLEALVTSPALKSDDLAAFHSQAQELVRLRGDFVVMRDRTGQQLLNTHVPWGTPLPRATDPVLLETDRKVFETGRPAISDLFMATVAKQLIVLVDVPVLRDGKPVYVVNLGIAPERFLMVFGSQAIAGEWTVALIDRRDRIVARSRRHGEFVGQQATDDLRHNTAGAEGVWTGTTLEGARVLGAYARSRLSDWRVAVTVPTAALDAPLRRLLALLIAGGALALTLSALLAARFAHGIGQPIQALASAAREVGAGKLVSFSRTGLKEADEVGEALVESSIALGEREADLRGSEERYRALVEVSPQVVWFGDADAR